MIMEKFINNQYFLRVEVVSMSVEKISLYFLGGDPIQYKCLFLCLVGQSNLACIINPIRLVFYNLTIMY